MNLIILKVWSEYFRAGEIQSRKSSQSFTITERTEGKEVCLNIQNNDEKCFLWSILASLHPLQHKNHPDKVSKCQEYEHELNMVGVRYPVDIKVIWKFEHQNNISVNVYGYKDKKLFLLRTTTVTTARHHVNLLYITSGKTSHYVLVKDLSRHQVNITITTTKSISVNILCMDVSVKRYWKTIWEDVSYTGHKESSFQKLATKRGVTKSSFYKKKIATTFTFCHLCWFGKCFT